jgi:hypothetical protein
MAGRRLLGVFWVTEPRRADDARSLVELRALGPRSGALAFSHPVRDLRYRGPLPP